jgi:hypothetical protein
LRHKPRVVYVCNLKPLAVGAAGGQNGVSVSLRAMAGEHVDLGDA